LIEQFLRESFSDLAGGRKQVRILPILSEKHLEYGRSISGRLLDRGIRASIKRKVSDKIGR